MVWARTKLMIHDDLFRPVNRVVVKYGGPNPEKFYKEIRDLMLLSFRVNEHAIQEKEYHWFKGTPEKFKVRWEINKDLDKFSYYWIDIKLTGETSKSGGKAEIVVDGGLRTEYPQDTFWQKSLLYEFLRMFWHTTFYSSRRDEFLREGRLLISSFVNEIRVLTRC